ncbi:oligosaccharide flippase family protein [Gordonia sp. SMJS1]|uniref:lipopolysaccharide biosynthesis protein n=1 Tax=Gordonia sp. SMJS1 TaxID=3039400 RepID=UPI0032AF84DD
MSKKSSGSGVFGSSGLLTITQLARMVSLFLVTVLIARSEGPAALGQFSLAIAFVTLLQLGSTGGLAGAGVLSLLRQNDGTDSAAVSISAVRTTLIPPIFVVGFVVFLAVASDSSYALFVATLFVGYAIGAYDLPELILTARGRFRALAMVRLILVVLIASPKLFLAWNGSLAFVLVLQGLEAALWQMALLPITGGLLKVFTRGALAFREVRKQLRDKRLLWVSGLAAAASTRADLLMVGWLLGASAAGVYSAATRPIEAIGVIGIAITTVVFNPLAAASSDSTIYAERAHNASRTVLMWGAVLTVAGCVVGPPAVAILYGPEFGEAKILIALYSVTILLVFQRQLVSKILLIERAYGYSLVSNTACLFIVVGGAALTAHRWGLTGVIVSTIVAYAVSSFGILLLTRKGRSILALSVMGVRRTAKSDTHTSRLLRERAEHAETT